MKLKLLILVSLLILTSTAYAQYTPNAVTIPAISGDMTAVNFREGPSTSTNVLGQVPMYRNIYINGETESFYSGAAICSDSTEQAGFVSKSYVKPFEELGTAYTSNTNDKYNMANIDVYQYPLSTSKKTQSLEPGTNVNLLVKSDNWYYCEFKGKYGFIHKSNLTEGWLPSQELSKSRIEEADKLMQGAYVFAVNEHKALSMGKTVEVEQPLIIHNGSTMMPLKSTSIFCDAKTSWDDTQKTATLILGNKTLKVKNGSDIMYCDGTETKMSAPAFIKDGRLHVPIRAITNAVGLKIYYFGNNLPFVATSAELDYPTARHILDSALTKIKLGYNALAWPVPSSSGLSSSFGDGRGHKAIDITAEKGTKVIAAASGVITEVFTGCTHDYPKSEACCGGGYGNYVVIAHTDKINGQTAQTRYSHLTKTDATTGQRVKAGDIVGYVGCTGRSTGDHLDFELSLDGVKTDPAQYISVPDDIYDSGNNGLYTKPYIDKLKALREQ